MVIVAKRKKNTRWNGVKLRSLRENAGLTQADLAEAAGMYPAEVSNYERGVNEPSYSAACRLAEVLGVKADAFQAPSDPG